MCCKAVSLCALYCASACSCSQRVRFVVGVPFVIYVQAMACLHCIVLLTPDILGDRLVAFR